MLYESFSSAETYDIGKKLGNDAKPGDIYCLTGELAAGKTVFAKGFGSGLGVTREITSPTFTILNTYRGRIPLYHFDVYRVGSVEEMDDTGYEDFFYGDGVCLVEWAETIKELIPPEAVWIEIERDVERSQDYRRIMAGRQPS